ncbi:hypothetical protein TNCT_647741 [Trichonephila clavata]|uniref:Uncharacterized protein n=1 Tax=Trichonephila clavata TaxID=2740835 RepID=A0A8X6KFM5_TRICU|nr:hypothetical protein TNCT_647741 [Trichonephila clavata]
MTSRCDITQTLIAFPSKWRSSRPYHPSPELFCSENTYARQDENGFGCPIRLSKRKKVNFHRRGCTLSCRELDFLPARLSDAWQVHPAGEERISNGHF